MPTGMILLILCVILLSSGHRRRHRWALHLQERESLREVARLREMVEDLSARFHRLETERDFYRDLLEPGGTVTKWKGPTLFGEAALPEDVKARAAAGPTGASPGP